MTQPFAPVSIETLLSQSDWVRRLAYSLTRDPAEAEDLVQETWLAVAQHPPAHASNLKSWLRTVMKNVRRKRWRGETRRAAREHAVARSEVADDVAELAARASMLSKVAGHVHGLDEAQRAVVLLRYFDDLPPRKIAERLGVPVNTVNSRLQRAHGRLRELLRDEFGDGWAAALLPLLRWPPNSTSAPGTPTAARPRSAARWLTAAASLVALGVAAAIVVHDRRAPGSASTAGESAAAGASSPASATQRRHSDENGAPATADAASAAAGPDAATTASVPADVDNIRAAGSITLGGPDTVRVTVRFTALAAADRDIGGDVRTIEAAPGPITVTLPRRDAKGRRIVEWRVDTEAPGYLPMSVQARVPLSAEGGDAEIPAITLTPAPIATGIVNWEASPGATARVGAFLLDYMASAKPFDLVRVAPGAEFRLRLPPAQRAVVVAFAEGCLPVGREIDATAPGEIRSAGDFALPAGNWIRGRIDAESVGFEPNVELRFFSRKQVARCLDLDDCWISWDGTSARRYGAVLHPGPDGQFAAGGLEREPFTLVLHGADRVAKDIADPLVNRVFEPSADAVDLSFRGTPFEVAVTSGGRAVARARVRLTQADGRVFAGFTDGNGAVKLLGKPGSRYAVLIDRADEYVPLNEELTVPESGAAPRMSVDLVAKAREPTATWTVRVRSAAGGVPAVVGLGLFVPMGKGDVFEAWPRVVHDITPVDGVCRIENIPPGRWRLEIRPGCTWYDPAGFETAPALVRQLGSGELAEDEVTGAPAGRAVLEVSGLAGVEQIVWPVRVRNDANETLAVLFSERWAAYMALTTWLPWGSSSDVFPALPPGRYTLEADAEAVRKLDGFSVPFEVVAGRVTHVPVKITRR